MKNNSYLILNKEEIKTKYSYGFSEYSPFDIGIPMIKTSDKTIEEIYYYRWHTFCSHIKQTQDGYVITEFSPDVHWAGKYNTISCAAGHHLYEGRWLYEQKFIDSYTKFWFSQGAEPRKYSFWVADAVLAVADVTGDYSKADELYFELKKNYEEWEREKRTENGLFYQIDDNDGMEFSAGGSGLRPTINSYMYGELTALSKIAARLNLSSDAELFAQKAKNLKEQINIQLWDTDASFYKTFNTDTNSLSDVREQIGYVPWYFGIPDDEKSVAWRFLNDERYFYAPYGPTTTERCSAKFMEHFDHECLWNGPSWPFATSQTLTALGNLLNNYNQSVMNRSDYYSLVHLYANSHYLTENGKTVPFIDENLDPFSGEWLARKILNAGKPAENRTERGIYYNHSTFCDLVLSGLAGIRSGDGNILIVSPLFTQDDLEYFCADGILYHNNYITVSWDKNGNQLGCGKGFYVYCNGECIFSNETPTLFEYRLKEEK